MADEVNVFHWADYLVFVLMLLISAGIGIVFGWVNRKKKTTKDFLLGGGDLSIFPVGISITASFTSAIAILGFSAEMYRFGTMYWMTILSYPLAQCTAAIIYIPFFHKLNITSAYEYLERRFHRYVKIATSIVFCLQMFFYMSVALYTPALAIEQVTGIPLVLSIVGTGGICALYTVIGGMKATVWIDTFQVGIMFTGLFTIFIKGSLDIKGGFAEIWRRAEATGRIEFFDFNPNPFTRHTFWTLVLGGFFTNLTVYGSNQGTIQRYLTVKKWTDASKALMLNLFAGSILLTVTCLCGLVAFGTYYDCDLLGSGKITRTEQMLPFLVMDLLGSLPGLPGLFVAAIYSAALSTISSGMNALAAVCVTDFIKPAYNYKKGKPLEEKVAALVAKLMALGFGVAGIGMAYLCNFLGNAVLQLTQSIFGLLGGPILGVISLGIFVPYANWVGALVGVILSAVINMWLGVGGVIYAKSYGLKPLTTEGCAKGNLTTIISMTTMTTSKLAESTTPDEGLYIYQLSYFYYSLLAVIIVFISGILVTFITYHFKWVERKPVDQIYYMNYSSFFSRKNKVKNVSKEEISMTDQTGGSLSVVSKK